MDGTVSRILRIRSPNSSGRAYPTVSGTLITVAPARMAASIMRHRNSKSVLDPSSVENSTSRHRLFAYLTASTAISQGAFAVAPQFLLYLNVR